MIILIYDYSKIELIGFFGCDEPLLCIDMFRS